MLALVQRVSNASVLIEGQTIASIDRGLLALIGIHRADTPADVDWLADRLAGLRIFPDSEGRMNLSVLQIAPSTPAAGPEGSAPAGGGVLLVPNFTLCARTGKGHRPSFTDAMAPAAATVMFDQLLAAVAARVPRTELGRFGADMRVVLENDGPVTLIIDSRRTDATG